MRRIRVYSSTISVQGYSWSNLPWVEPWGAERVQYTNWDGSSFWDINNDDALAPWIYNAGGDGWKMSVEDYAVMISAPAFSDVVMPREYWTLMAGQSPQDSTAWASA